MNNKYAGIIENDVVNGEGVCVSFFTQGCPHRCPGCFNPETWDFDGGLPLSADYKNKILSSLVENGVQRNFSILGGEPLCKENEELTLDIVTTVRNAFPHIKIYLWTGFYLSDLLNSNNTVVNCILDKIDVLIDGPFEIEKKDLTLKLRGSSNQTIYRKDKNNKFIRSQNE